LWFCLFPQVNIVMSEVGLQFLICPMSLHWRNIYTYVIQPRNAHVTYVCICRFYYISLSIGNSCFFSHLFRFLIHSQ
jgi:hypothetical protein